MKSSTLLLHETCLKYYLFNRHRFNPFYLFRGMPQAQLTSIYADLLPCMHTTWLVKLTFWFYIVDIVTKFGFATDTLDCPEHALVFRYLRCHMAQLSNALLCRKIHEMFSCFLVSDDVFSFYCQHIWFFYLICSISVSLGS